MSSIVPIRSQRLAKEKPSTAGVVVPVPRSLYAEWKFVFDFVAALALFIATAPLLLLAMALVKLTSRGPALYVQLRMGRGGKPFPIYKIRTMYFQCEQHSGVKWSVPGDSRILPLGRWLRRLHLDELPQLWNVIRGDMSLVGPRPERPEFVPQLEQALAHYGERLLLCPGVTGLAQVQLPPDTDLNSVRTKLAYDLYYLQNVSLWFDLRIVGATLFKMLALPFTAIRRCFAFPSEKEILAVYHNLGRVEACKVVVDAGPPALSALARDERNTCAKPQAE
jgi:lipopolysaccharide/colanic/teichoic acid biosynthesis glycosyltransferase